MKQPFEKLVEQHSGTVGRHVDVNELIERYPRLFHLAEAGLAPAKVLTDMSARQWLSALNERVFFWLHSQRLDQLLTARRNRGRTPWAAVVELAVSGGMRDISGHVIDVYRRVA